MPDSQLALKDMTFDPDVKDASADYYISRYALHRKSLSGSARDAVWASIQASGKEAGDRRYWSSVVFTRLIATCNSLLQLCPLSLNDILANWDFSSVASLTRNLFEGYLFFTYISEPTNGDEWRARLNIMQLCDCMSRIRLFEQLGSKIEAAKFRPAADDLQNRLEQNPFFVSLDTKLQKQLIQGTRAAIYTSRELSIRAEVNQTVWGYFELFSSHAHSLPLSFYRLEEQGRQVWPTRQIRATYRLLWISPPRL